MLDNDVNTRRYVFRVRNPRFPLPDRSGAAREPCKIAIATGPARRCGRPATAPRRRTREMAFSVAPPLRPPDFLAGWRRSPGATPPRFAVVLATSSGVGGERAPPTFGRLREELLQLHAEADLTQSKGNVAITGMFVALFTSCDSCMPSTILRPKFSSTSTTTSMAPKIAVWFISSNLCLRPSRHRWMDLM